MTEAPRARGEGRGEAISYLKLSASSNIHKGCEESNPPNGVSIMRPDVVALMTYAYIVMYACFDCSVFCLVCARIQVLLLFAILHIQYTSCIAEHDYGLYNV